MMDILANIEFTPFLLSFKLASVTTLILFFISLPLAGIYRKLIQK